MTDTLSKQARSERMARIRGKDTVPELKVRKLAHKLGYRFRLHRKDLPGKPDLVFASKRKVIFVHGCFWHGHDCKLGRLPKSNVEFWAAKIKRNRERDLRNISDLQALGWEVELVWQCRTRDTKELVLQLQRFLSPPVEIRSTKPSP